MKPKAEDSARQMRESLQLRRLARMTDVAYAILFSARFSGFVARRHRTGAVYRYPGARKRYCGAGGHCWGVGLDLCNEKSPFVTARSYQVVCSSTKRSYSGRTDHRNPYHTICICGTDHLGDILGELSARGLAGKGTRTKEKVVN